MFAVGSGVGRSRARLLPASILGSRARGPASACGKILLVGLLALGCGDDEQAIGEAARISGTVRDEASGGRLKGAHVVFTSDTLETAEGRTNDDGEYHLTVATRAVNGRIQASKKGYRDTTVSVYLDDNTVQTDVDLPRAD
jgi:hypothetical protein